MRQLTVEGLGFRKTPQPSWHCCRPSGHGLEEVLSSELPQAGSCLASSNWVFPAAFSLAASPGTGSLLMRIQCQSPVSSIPLGCGWYGPAQGGGELPSPTGARPPGAALSPRSPYPASDMPSSCHSVSCCGLGVCGGEGRVCWAQPTFIHIPGNERLHSWMQDPWTFVQVARQPGGSGRPLLGLAQGPLLPLAQTLLWLLGMHLTSPPFKGLSLCPTSLGLINSSPPHP